MEDKTIGELTEEERKAFLAALEKKSPGAVENIRMLVDLFSAFKGVFSELKGVLSELKGVLSDPAAYDGIPVASDEEMQPLRELSTDTFMDSMVSLAESDKSKYERVMARLMFDLFSGEKSKPAVSIGPLKETPRNAVDLYSVLTHYPPDWFFPKDISARLVLGNTLPPDVKTPIAIEREGKEKITTYVRVSLTDLPDGVKTLIDPTPHDIVIHNAICTLSKENNIITYQMIYQAITGNPNAKITSQWTEIIDRSVTRLMHTPIYIDAKQEAAAYKHHVTEYDGAIIAAERLKNAKLNGQLVEGCIHLFREPILLSLSAGKNQIGRLDIKLLNTPINKTPDVILLQNYLMDRILAIPRINNKVLFETIYQELCVSTDKKESKTRKKQATIRQQAIRMLDYWKTQKGKDGKTLITGYELVKKGNTIDGVKIYTTETTGVTSGNNRGNK